MQKAECAKNDEMGNCSVYLMQSLDFLYFNNESLWKVSVFIEFIWNGVIRICKRVDILTKTIVEGLRSADLTQAL